jgi:hypothetical protein
VTTGGEDQESGAGSSNSIAGRITERRNVAIYLYE